jgi:hypothetical protein
MKQRAPSRTSRDWTIKSRDPDETASALLDEELEYVKSNPHADVLRDVFRRARIEYGRMDYALLDGRVQVWEINSNPMITSRGGMDPVRGTVREYFGNTFEAAFRALDTGQ